MGHVRRHPRRPGRGGCRHRQGPYRPPPGPPLLRPARRGGPVGKRPQLPEDEQAGEGRAEARRRMPDADRVGGRNLALGGRAAQRGNPRGLARKRRQPRKYEGPGGRADGRRIRRDGDELPRLRPRDAQDRQLRRRDPPERIDRRHYVQRAEGADSRTKSYRDPLLPERRQRDGRCPAVPGGLPLRLHRADAQPVRADGHHAESPARHGPEPQGHPRQADEPQRRRDRRRHQAGGGLEAEQPTQSGCTGAQPRLRRRRRTGDGAGGRDEAVQPAARRRRVGLVQRVRRVQLAAHHRHRRSRAPSRATTMSSCRRACSSAASHG